MESHAPYLKADFLQLVAEEAVGSLQREEYSVRSYCFEDGGDQVRRRTGGSRSREQPHGQPAGKWGPQTRNSRYLNEHRTQFSRASR